MENKQSGFSGQGNQENQNQNRQDDSMQYGQNRSDSNPAHFSKEDDFSIDNENSDNISTGDYTGSESSSTLYRNPGSEGVRNFAGEEMYMDDQTREASDREYETRGFGRSASGFYDSEESDESSLDRNTTL